MTNKLETLNRGKRSTYRHEGLDREEVIDLTLSSILLKSRIKDWYVSDEPSLSDHRHVCFNMDADSDSAELDRAADKLTATILTAWETCCPVVHRKAKRVVPWWSKGLQEQRRVVGRLPIAKRSGV
jgi:hypothetical protein